MVCVLAVLLGFGLVGEASEVPKAGATYEWNTRLELSAEQQKLLHLYTQFEIASSDAAKGRALEEEINRLKVQLGTNAVRRARAGELVVTPTGQTNQFSIYNPSAENVSFTVSIKGDEQRMGTRMASMGRDTYLPAHGTLLVTNLYWTTPRMDMRK
ncbi:MAG: hypothetical protein JWQ04_2380 [Pedosphaera sp.]|nr:hypothetical protein [Pedosphaera sp.]